MNVYNVYYFFLYILILQIFRLLSQKSLLLSPPRAPRWKGLHLIIYMHKLKALLNFKNIFNRVQNYELFSNSPNISCKKLQFQEKK